MNMSNGMHSKDGLRLAAARGGDRRTGILLGTCAAFYRTADNGEHWVEKTSGMATVPCYGVSVNKIGTFSVAYGDKCSGSFVNRRVGNGTWNVVQDNSIFDSPGGSLYCGFAIAASTMNTDVVLASGTTDESLAQMIFRSSDAGETWLKVYANDFANQSCNIIFDPHDDRFAYTADLHHVLKSSDSGITWHRLPNSPPYVYSIGVAASPGLVSTTLYAGGSRQMYKSDDGGNVWFSASAGLPSPVVSLACDPVDPQIVYAGTNHDRIYWTTNGGSTWQPRREGVYGDFIQSIAVNPANRVLYVCAADYYGAISRVYRSTNLGETWRDISEGLAGAVVYQIVVDKTNANAVYCATNRGIFRLFDDDRAIATHSGYDHSKPLTFDLSQNFPNPFNPTTTINYQLPTVHHVTMKVFDVLGREVATVVNGVEEAGYKSMNWDASGFSSGTYFYRLQAGGFTQTRKLVLLR